MTSLYTFSIKEDYRVGYKERNNHYFLVDIGTHEQIYRHAMYSQRAHCMFFLFT